MQGTGLDAGKTPSVSLQQGTTQSRCLNSHEIHTRSHMDAGGGCVTAAAPGISPWASIGLRGSARMCECVNRCICIIQLLCLCLLVGLKMVACSPVHTQWTEGEAASFHRATVTAAGTHTITHTHTHTLTSTFFSLRSPVCSEDVCSLINLNTAPMFPRYLFEQLSEALTLSLCTIEQDWFGNTHRPLPPPPPSGLLQFGVDLDVLNAARQPTEKRIFLPLK